MGMSRLIGTSTAGVLFALSLLHVYWAAGGSWGTDGYRKKGRLSCLVRPVGWDRPAGGWEPIRPPACGTGNGSPAMVAFPASSHPRHEPKRELRDPSARHRTPCRSRARPRPDPGGRSLDLRSSRREASPQGAPDRRGRRRMGRPGSPSRPEEGPEFHPPPRRGCSRTVAVAGTAHQKPHHLGEHRHGKSPEQARGPRLHVEAGEGQGRRDAKGVADDVESMASPADLGNPRFARKEGRRGGPLGRRSR